MILQKSIREFEHRQKGFSDTTFILDDARLPKSQTIRQSTVDVIERCGRAAFDKSDTRITPIITGEGYLPMPAYIVPHIVFYRID